MKQMEKEDIILHMMKAAYLLDGEFDLTREGVPRIIVKLGAIKASLVYVARSNQWKMFSPFPSNGNQRRECFSNLPTVLRTLEERRKGC